MENSLQMRRLLSSTPVLGIALQPLYFTLIEATLQGKEFGKLPLTHPARAYKSIADRISVSTTGTTDVTMLDSTRIIVRPNAVQSIMKELHRAHSGIQNGRVAILLAGHEEYNQASSRQLHRLQRRQAKPGKTYSEDHSIVRSS